MATDLLSHPQLRDDVGSRWVSVGRSNAYDAPTAAAEATRRALEDRGDHHDVQLLLVLGPNAPASQHSAGRADDPTVIGQRIASAVADAARTAGAPAGVHAIGCSTAGQLGLPDPDRGATVIAIGGDARVQTAAGREVSTRSRQAGVELGVELRPDPRYPFHLAILLGDGRAGDQQELVRGAYGEWGATVPLVGALASGEPPTTPTWQLHGAEALTNSAVAALISSHAPTGVAVRHGWHSGDDGMIITASTGNVLYELDDQPALDVMMRRHGVPPGVEQDASTFMQFLVRWPLAITRRQGQSAIRQIVRADTAKRALICTGMMPKGAQVHVATTDVATTIAAADEACEAAVAELDGVPIKALLVFDCVGRRMVLPAEALADEWAAMSRHAAQAPIAGFYGNGEFARVHGATGFHNQTIVACALG